MTDDAKWLLGYQGPRGGRALGPVGERRLFDTRRLTRTAIPSDCRSARVGCHLLLISVVRDSLLRLGSDYNNGIYATLFFLLVVFGWKVGLY
jgi:hypothetical protein